VAVESEQQAGHLPADQGSGKRLFADGRTPSSFRLADLKFTPTGVTIHTYELAGAPTYGTATVD
jgi:hypothetical protein